MNVKPVKPVKTEIKEEQTHGITLDLSMSLDEHLATLTPEERAEFERELDSLRQLPEEEIDQIDQSDEFDEFDVLVDRDV